VTTLAAGGHALAPWWAVLPLALLTLLVLAGHVLSLARIEMPASRRRIRTANGLVMMLTVPLGAYAVGIADPRQDQRSFVLAWMMVAGLLLVVLLVAGLDIVNTWRLHRREHRDLVRTLAAPAPAPERVGTGA
jgi:protein-S-isoprenylcysteine O-methyltransferase Ste14